MTKKRYIFYCTGLVICLVFSQAIAISQPGQLDSTFNGTGSSFVSDSPSFLGQIFSGLFQNDGKLLFAGSGFNNPISKGDALLVRFNQDGTADNSFGNKGIVFTDFGNEKENFFCVSMQPDGKIIAGGNKDYSGNPQKGIAARYSADGKLDSSFGINGKFITNYNPSTFAVEGIYQMKPLENGKIFVTASNADSPMISQRLLHALYLFNGSLDSSFGINGLIESNNIDKSASTDLAGRKIYYGIHRINDLDYLEVSRRMPDGTMDLSFNGTGVSFTFIDSLGATPSVCVIQSNNKILIGGSVNTKGCDRSDCSGHDFLLVRYKDNGLIDSSFGDHGISRLRLNNSNDLQRILLQGDDKILVAGTVSPSPASWAEGYFGIARFLPDGKLDSSFGDNGKKVFDNLGYTDGRLSGMLIRGHRIYLYGATNNISISSTGFLVYALHNDYYQTNTTTIKLCQGTSQTSLVSDIIGTSYQWQQSNDGINFTNITDNEQFTGTGSSTLLLKSLSPSWSGYKYRCITNKDTGSIFIIRFVNAWAGTVNNNWEEPVNWSCGVLPNDQTDVVIYNSSVKINADVSVKSLTLKLDATISISTGHSLIITGSSFILPE